MLVAQPDYAFLDVLLIDLARRASGESPAVRSLEVAKLDDRHRGIGIPFKVAGLGDDRGHQRFTVNRGGWVGGNAG